MTANLHSNIHSLAGRAGEESLGEASAPRKRKEDEEVWAFAIAETLAREVPRLHVVSTAGELAEGPSGDSSGNDLGADASRSALPRQTSANAAADATLSESPRGASTFGVAESSAGDLPERLITELSDARLGRMELTVARSGNGLTIVINVADARVKALIEADQAALMKSLQDCGLRVASVKIGHSAGSGTGLAEERLERVRTSPNLSTQTARRRAYRSSLDEEDDADTEGVDFTA